MQGEKEAACGLEVCDSVPHACMIAATASKSVCSKTYTKYCSVLSCDVIRQAFTRSYLDGHRRCLAPQVSPMFDRRNSSLAKAQVPVCRILYGVTQTSIFPSIVTMTTVLCVLCTHSGRLYRVCSGSFVRSVAEDFPQAAQMHCTSVGFVDCM